MIKINKKQKSILAVIAIILLAIASFVFIKNRSNKTEEEIGLLLPQTKALTVDQMPTVGLTAKDDGRELTLVIETNKDLADNRIEYELIYYLEDDLSRGAMGEIILKHGRGEKDILLGTCSRNICRYDEGVIGGQVIISLAQDNQLHSFETVFAFLNIATPYNSQDLKITTTSQSDLIVLEGGGLLTMPESEIIAGPYVITSEPGTGTIDFNLPDTGKLVFLNEGVWEEVDNNKNLPPGTYLLIAS